MDGMVELAEEVFHVPVRLGMPNYLGGLSEVVKNPIYSTGVGLIEFGLLNYGGGTIEKSPENPVDSAFERMKSWFKGSF